MSNSLVEADPLADTVFRPTTLSPVGASAGPVREPGTRSRAGNAMSRTRAAILDGAAEVVAADGTKLVMAQVAAAGGVAKATLYNHFRTREAVLAALTVHRVTRLIEQLADLPLAEALTEAALAVASDPVRCGLAGVEPAALASLARIDLRAEGWRLADVALRQRLAGHGPDGAPLVLRWLASFLTAPADRAAIRRDVELMLRALPEVPPTAPEASGRPDQPGIG